MAIDLHFSYSLNPSDPTYRGERNFLLKAAENNLLRLNPNSATQLTVKLDNGNNGRLVIGYGYDLFANRERAEVDFSAVGLTITQAQKAAILNLTAASLSSIPSALAGLTLPSEVAATTLLDNAAAVREAELTRFFRDHQRALDDSRERAVLVSMWYQTPAYFRTGTSNGSLTNMGRALVSGERAEAWFEMRYGSSKGVGGVVKRRFAESKVFGLYNDEGNIQLDEAKSVYRMYTLHRAQILDYESRFGALIVAANGDYQLQGANIVQPLNANLTPALPKVLEWLNTLLPAGMAPITLAAINGDASAILVDPGRDRSADAVLSDHAGVLIATTYTAAGSEISAKNVLVGEAGNDYLLGGKGDDTLIGGPGADIYYFRKGDGQDTIIDSDTNGSIVRGNSIVGFGKVKGGLKTSTTPNVWTDSSSGVTTTYTFNPSTSDLVISFNDDSNDTITIKNFNVAQAAGDFLGIRLIDAPAAPSGEARTFIGDKAVWDSDGNPANGVQPQADGFGNVILADGQDGRPDVAAPDQADTIFGSNGTEVEVFRTGGGDDTIGSDGPNFGPGTPGGRDLVEAGAGSDIVAAGAGADWIEGGTGSDILGGGDGNDVLFAESSNGQTLTVDQAIAAGAVATATPGVGDLLSGDAGDDILVGSNAADVLLGGLGEEIIVGGAGDDTIYGDATLDVANRGWSVTRVRSGSGSTATFTVNASGYSILEGGAAGGLDILYGGAGDDWIFAGAGDDTLDGGSGNDVLLGEGGNDVLLGGEGDDFLDGDSAASVAAGLAGDDFLDGGNGNDVLLGEAGNDVLYGGAGDDILVGGDGNDTLYGGPGTDVLIGGAGKDTYVFNRGDGVEVIQDTPAGSNNSEASVLVLGPGILPSEVKFRLGSLMIDIGQGDAIHIEGFDSDNPYDVPVLEAIEFASGGYLSFEDILAQGFDLDGTAGDDVILGTAVTDRINALGGNDVIFGKAGDDTIDAGAGDDTVEAGAGNDLVITGEGADLIDTGEGDDTVFADEGDLLIDGSGTNHLDLTAYTGLDATNLEITQYAGPDSKTYLNFHVLDAQNPGATPASGGLSVQEGALGAFATVTLNDGVGGTATFTHAELMTTKAAHGFIYLGTEANESLAGTNFADTMLGGAGDDTLAGNAGADKLDGGAGNDLLEGGAGNDTYLLALNGGRDTVIEDAQAEPNATHAVQLDAGLVAAQVRAVRVGDDLEVRIKATADALVIKDFFNAAQSWQDGWSLTDVNANSVALSSLLPVTPPDPGDWLAEQRSAYTARREQVYAANRQAEGYAALGGNTFQRVETFYQYSLANSVSNTFVAHMQAQTDTDDGEEIYVDPEYDENFQGGGQTGYALAAPRTSALDGARLGASVSFGGGGGPSEGQFIPTKGGTGVKVNPGDVVVPVYAASVGNLQGIRNAGTPGYGSGGGFENSSTWEQVGVRVFRAGTAGASALLADPGTNAGVTNTNQTFEQSFTVRDLDAGDSDNTIQVAGPSAISAGDGNDTVRAQSSRLYAGPDWRAGLNFEGELDDGQSDAAARYVADWRGQQDDNDLGSFIDLGAGDDTLESSTDFEGSQAGAGQDVVYGGDGNDTLDAGRGSDTYLYSASKIGIDVLEDSGSDSFEYLDFTYWHAGIVNWDERYEHGTEWKVIWDGSFEGYFDSYAEAQQYVEEENFHGVDIVYIEPLPFIAPALTRDDTATLSALRNAGVLDHDVVEFGPGLAFGDLDITLTTRGVLSDAHPENPAWAGGLLSVRWNGGAAGFDTTVLDWTFGYDADPDETGLDSASLGTDDGWRLGQGIEAFHFADGSRFSLQQILGAAVLDKRYIFDVARDQDDLETDANWAYFDFAAGIAPEDVIITNSDEHLILRLTDESTTVEVSRWYATPPVAGAAVLRFEGGFVISAADVTRLGLTKTGDADDNELESQDGFTNTLHGLAGADQLYGGTGDDLLTGGADDDTLAGGNGSDTYFFDPGDGADTIDDEGGALDTVRFGPGILSTDVTGVGADGVLTLTVGTNGDRLSIVWDPANGRALERVVFDDATEWNQATLQAFFPGSNNPPSVANPVADQQADEDAAFSFQVPADAFIDPDAGDTLSYSASLADGGALPGWLSFDANSRSFSGTPAQADVGVVSLRVTATDGGNLSASDVFDLTVLNVNDAPVVTTTAATQTVLLDQSVAAASLFGVTDADGDPVAYFEFWDSTAGNGHFTVDGVEQGVNVAIAVSAAMLGDTVFSGASSAGSDQVWVRASDGQTWSAWRSWTMQSWPHATNAAPTVTAAAGAVLRDQSVVASTLFSTADADGDAIAAYEFWDDVAGGGYFSLDGVAQGVNPIAVSAVQLAGFSYIGGSNPGTEQVWVRASDGLEWGAWTAWNMTTALHIPNAAPVVSAATYTALLNESVSASALFSVLDADGDPVAAYEFWDSTAGGGYFSVNGVEQGVNVAIAVSAAQLADTAFVGGAASGSDSVWVRATDGQSWSDWKNWTVNSWPHATNAAPVVSAANASLLQNETIAAGALFSVSDADGDAMARYEFWDDIAGGGYFRVNGVQQGAAQAIAVTAAELAGTDYVAGANPGTEQVWVRANDGLEWGAWKAWNMTTALHIPNAAPVVTAGNGTLLLNEAVDASTLFAVTDADNDTITNYEFWDSTAGNGHFTVSGVEAGVNVAIAVSAAQLGATQFVASASTGSDQLWVRASDGQSWSDWKSWTVNSWPHATNAAPVVSAQSAGLLRNDNVAAAMLFGTTDADGDAVTAYEFWDDVNGGGHWAVNGVQQAAGTGIAVAAADLVNTHYVGGANAGTEQVWVRACDGMGWSNWKNWLMVTEGGMLRGGTGPDTLNGEAGPTVLEGGAGDDTLTDTEGNNLFSGGAGDDTMTGGAGNDLFAGGADDDIIVTGAGSNVVAFNAGDGNDTVISTAGASNTLSFGGGIDYDDLSLSKNGNDLVVHAGGGDQVVLKDWYAGNDNTLNLQIILDATNAFDANSSDPLLNKRVQSFDFHGLVGQFDAALAQSPGLTSWAVTNALLQYHLSGADDAALGGDLAYWYGRNNGFTGISLAAAQAAIGAAGFGAEAQTLHAFSGLQEGYVKLA